MKKSLIFTFCALFCASAGAQKYTVSGLAPMNAKVVYLRNMETPRDVRPDSVRVTSDRRFSFQSDAAGHLFAQVYTDREVVDVMPVILNGDVVVDFDLRVAHGTPENLLASQMAARMSGFNEQMEAIEAEVTELQKSGTQLTPEVIAPFQQRYEVLSQEMSQTVKEFCDENTESIVPAYFLRDVIYQIDRSDVIRWADAKAKFMGTSLMAPVNSRVEGWRRGEPGTMFTDLEENDVDGKPHKLSEYVGKGNYVLIDFWASWCGPCLRELPNVKAAYEKYHPKGFDIVGLSFDQDHKAWTGAINRIGMPWHHLSDLKGWETVASTTYGINAIPATLLVGPDGKIVANGLRAEKLLEKLAEIYGE
ncbi:MAG: TlpA family protein disulfide reductase [Alloprevotella sp.]|nr:TlpA family protein disulfide reductase [Alloprevotella sp.]